MTRGIYKIENKLNGMVYVGSSIDIERRCRQHRAKLRGGRHRNTHLQRAWDKYGRGAFTFAILEEVGGDDNSLLTREQKHLDDCFGHGDCYNMARDATASMRGRHHTEESKRKMREVSTGRRLSEETKRKLSVATTGERNPNWGKRHTNEAKLKMSKAKLGNQYTKGRKHTEEHRRKNSKAQMGNQNWLGKHHTDETRRKMSESQKRWWARKQAMAAGLSELIPNPSHPLPLWGGFRK